MRESGKGDVDRQIPHFFALPFIGSVGLAVGTL